MPTVLNVHEAKARFSGVLSEVENNLAIITIMRYGRPVAKIVPVARLVKSGDLELPVSPARLAELLVEQYAP